MGDDVEKQSFNKDRTRFSVENDAHKVLSSDIFNSHEVVKMQSLILDVLLDIRDELRDKSSVNKWGPKI